MHNFHCYKFGSPKDENEHWEALSNSLSILIGYANSSVEPTNDCQDFIKVFKNTKPQIKMETIPCMPNFQMALLC